MIGLSARFVIVCGCAGLLVVSTVLSLRRSPVAELPPASSFRARTNVERTADPLLGEPPAAETEMVAPSTATPEIPSALVAACGEWDPERRGYFIEAALRAWAARDVAAAGAWAQTQSFIARAVALAAVVNGAAEGDPAAAERYVAALVQAEPANAVEYGGFLLAALGDAGEHARAAEWASRSAAPQPEWLSAAYGRWARDDAPAAWLAANALRDDYARHLAARAALNAWAKAQPNQLLHYAAQMADGPDKTFALTTALRAWSAREPEQAAAWILEHREAFAGVPRPELILED